MPAPVLAALDVRRDGAQNPRKILQVDGYGDHVRDECGEVAYRGKVSKVGQTKTSPRRRSPVSSLRKLDDFERKSQPVPIKKQKAGHNKEKNRKQPRLVNMFMRSYIAFFGNSPASMRRKQYMAILLNLFSS